MNEEIVMKRIVLVFRSYPPETTANVVCMINVLNELKKLNKYEIENNKFVINNKSYIKY